MNVPLEIIDEPNTCHVKADIILPKEKSYISGYQYNVPGYDLIRIKCEKFTECIFAGISYWPHDRPELDYLIAQLKPTTKITIVNPQPPNELIPILKSKFSSLNIVSAAKELI